MKTPKTVQIIEGQVIHWPDGKRTLRVKDSTGEEWFVERSGPSESDHWAMAKALWLRSLKKKKTK